MSDVKNNTINLTKEEKRQIDIKFRTSTCGILEFKNCNLSSQIIQYIFHKVGLNPWKSAIFNLKFNNGNIEEGGVEILGESLKLNQNLHALHLYDIKIHFQDAQLLNGAVKVNSTLKNLFLKNNQMDADCARELSEALKENQTLTCLNIQFNNIGSQGAKYLSDALKVNKSLQVLDVRSNNIDMEGAKYLGEALEKNKSVENLCLGRNDIESDGFEFICESLKTNRSLQILDVTSTNIDAQGAYSLSECLKVNQTLKVLKLGSNHIGNLGLECLLDAMKVNKGVHTLILSENQIDSQGAVFLGEILMVNNTMHTLDLDNNRLYFQGAESLSGALRVNQTLRNLNLTNCVLSVQGLRLLFESLKVNQTLCSLHINGLMENVRSAENQRAIESLRSTLMTFVSRNEKALHNQNVDKRDKGDKLTSENTTKLQTEERPQNVTNTKVVEANNDLIKENKDLKQRVNFLTTEINSQKEIIENLKKELACSKNDSFLEKIHKLNGAEGIPSWLQRLQCLYFQWIEKQCASKDWIESNKILNEDKQISNIQSNALKQLAVESKEVAIEIVKLNTQFKDKFSWDLHELCEMFGNRLEFKSIFPWVQALSDAAMNVSEVKEWMRDSDQAKFLVNQD